jgi:predicted transcriptional regulator
MTHSQHFLPALCGNVYWRPALSDFICVTLYVFSALRSYLATQMIGHVAVINLITALNQITVGSKNLSPISSFE